MTSRTPRDIVLRVISFSLKVPIAAITDETELVVLAPDSIALFELLLQFEKILGRSVRYEEIAAIETVGDIITYAESLPPGSIDERLLREWEETAPE